MLSDLAECCPILAKKSKISLQIDHHYFGDNLADQQNDALGIALTLTDDNLTWYSGLVAYQKGLKMATFGRNGQTHLQIPCIGFTDRAAFLESNREPRWKSQ